MKPRIGYTLWHDDFRVEAPEPMLDEAVALGVDSVELPLFFLGLIVGGRPLAAPVARLAATIARYPLATTVHGHIAINLMEPEETVARHVEMARANIAVSADLGAERLVIHSGTCADDPATFAEARARQRDLLAGLGDAAARAGVLLCVETTTVNPGETTTLASELAADIAELGHPSVTGTLDYAHVALECARRGIDHLAEIEAMLPAAPHLHLNDCFSRPSPRGTMMPAEALAYGLGDLHLPIGWGSLPWDAYFSRPGYREGTILNLELNARHWSALPESIAAMRRFADAIATPEQRSATGA